MSAQLLICIHAHDHVESLFMLVSRRVDLHLIVSVSNLGGITRGRATAVGAFDLWERAKTVRMRDIEAGREQASIEMDSAVWRPDPFQSLTGDTQSHR